MFACLVVVSDHVYCIWIAWWTRCISFAHHRSYGYYYCSSHLVIRDIAERGRDLRGILEQYSRFVKPSFDDFIQPTVRNADIIIPRGLDNSVAIDLITKHIARQLEERKTSSSA